VHPPMARQLARPGPRKRVAPRFFHLIEHVLAGCSRRRDSGWRYRRAKRPEVVEAALVSVIAVGDSGRWIQMEVSIDQAGARVLSPLMNEHFPHGFHIAFADGETAGPPGAASGRIRAHSSGIGNPLSK